LLIHLNKLLKILLKMDAEHIPNKNISDLTYQNNNMNFPNFSNSNYMNYNPFQNILVNPFNYKKRE